MAASISVKELVDLVIKEMEKEWRGLGKFNLMILGKTGAGKSTLVNSVFMESLADTGIGRPVTKSIKKYQKADFPLGLYDTPGLELSGAYAVESLLDEVVGLIKEGLKQADLDQAIHCIWYCVNVPSNRFEQAEIDFIKELAARIDHYHVSIVLVLTQAFSKQKASHLKSEIEKENLPLAQIVPLLAEDYMIDEDYMAKAYGLDRLVQVTMEIIPEAVRKAFVAIQQQDVNLKITRAKAIVKSTALAAAGIGAAPIPFSDAALLVPAQIAMISRISVLFGFRLDKTTMTAIISATIGTMGATVFGKAFVANLVKLVPGGGSLAGGLISASTAAALTAALGEAYILILTKVWAGEMNLADLKTRKGKQAIRELFKGRLKLKRGQGGQALEDK